LFCADFGLRDCGAPQGFDSPAFRFVGTQLRLMRAYRFFNLCAGAHNRVQRGHGLLKDHGNLTAANVAPLAFGKRGQGSYLAGTETKARP
jgi:hypothetical protein